MRSLATIGLLALWASTSLACATSDGDAAPQNRGDSAFAADSVASDTDASLDASAEAAEDSADFDSASDGAVDVPPVIPEDTAVYAHSQSRLYRLDAKTLAVTDIGAFVDTSGVPIDSMTDIALDKDANMFGVTFGTLLTIDYKAAGGPVCTQIATLDGEFNGLTFIPAGMIDPGKEVLIGTTHDDGGWWRIDVESGATKATLTKLGSFGGGLVSSGDSVGIIGDKVYATVEGTSGPGDHVIVVDPKTGAKLSDLGDSKIPGIWGVGYWGGKMYGFKSSGQLYEIELPSLASKEIPLTVKPDTGWWGAGVRTSAPNTPTK